MNDKLRKKIAKGFVKGIKRLGFRSDDVIGFLDEVDINKHIETYIKKIEDENDEKNIVFVGNYESGDLKFRAIAVKEAEIDGEKCFVFGKNHAFDFLDEKKYSLTLNELLKRLIDMFFDLKIK